MAADNGWPPFTAIDKTGNQTGKMGQGDEPSGGKGGDCAKPNPYGPTQKGDVSHGPSGRPKSHEDYSG